MQEKKEYKIVSSKRTRYILPNIITLVGVCLGISSIKFSLDQNYDLAVIFILVAAILDALDGRVARLIKGTSEFGKELDSLTDFVSFGIAPVFIIYFWHLNNYGKIGWAITLIYSVCCVLRLARFNLIKNNENQKWKQNYFEGIPSPIGAILILLPLIYEISDFYQVKDIRFFSPFLTIFISILLISKIPTYSFKRISINPKLTIFIFLGIGIAFVSLIFFTFESLFLFGFIYFFSLPLSFYTYKKNKDKNKDVSQEEDHEDIL
jgi:CDP-diacylglycerol--serine O-phosphatidyltransferase|tara:strand:- start:208 stop:999 length:792 start_codon:yes stop_codon:yes gene_type:complete